MSERKVLTKYYPPDFDPSKIVRQRGSKSDGPSKLATVRLMAPFSMKCLTCGEFIYKGRKFNARKETTDTRYLNNIPIYRFYIRCTRCSGEITFKTDPKNMDYVAEKGARRNFEAWRSGGEKDERGNDKFDGNGGDGLETEEEMLDRLEEEAAIAQGAGGAMADLEAKVLDARTEMAVADALDEIRVRNARIQRAEGREGGDDLGEGSAVETAERKRVAEKEERRRREEREDDEAARRAFGRRRRAVDEGDDDGQDGDAVQIPPSGKGTEKEKTMAMAGDQQQQQQQTGSTDMPPPPPPAAAPVPTFKKTVKKKKDFAAALGIVKKPSLV